MSEHATTASAHVPTQNLSALSLAALGVVFGDIGTSPLYTLKTVLDVTGGVKSDPAAILGALSLILWTLIIVTSVKYVALALRVDNGGEGGILALMALLRRMHGRQPLVIFLALFGAALVYGDATITPAISVMSALEGLEIVAPQLERFVVPVTVVVLIALFSVQRQGTARIGGLFGPVMRFGSSSSLRSACGGSCNIPPWCWQSIPVTGLPISLAAE